jgi:hypothetical protein
MFLTTVDGSVIDTTEGYVDAMASWEKAREVHPGRIVTLIEITGTVERVSNYLSTPLRPGLIPPVRIEGISYP